jgi:hypothetical protein
MPNDLHGLLHLQLDALAVGSQSNPVNIVIPRPILSAIDARYQVIMGGKNHNGGGRLYDRLLFYEELVEDQMYDKRPHPALVTHLLSVRAQREWLVLNGLIKR